MRLKTNPIFLFLFALFVTASTARAQLYEFQFVTSSPGFGGELFFNAPSGSAPLYSVLDGSSFITTPDGTFTVSASVQGGPFIINPPPTVWGPDGITALNLNLYESLGPQLYNWTATPTGIGDAPAAAIPLGPNFPGRSAAGTWVYVVPEPDAMPLVVLSLAVAMLVRSMRRNSSSRRTAID